MNQTFQNYLTVSWDQVLCKDGDILEFFKLLGIKDLKDIQITSRTYSDDDRMIINVTADNEEDKIIRIVIDSTAGIPTWQQFVNVTYDQQDSADIKIILYGDEYRDYQTDFTAGGILEIGNLVRRNNLCGAATYLVKGIDFDRTGRKILNRCSIEEDPNSVPVDPNRILATKRQVQEAEFWTGYYFPQAGPESIIEIYDEIIDDWAPGYSLTNDLRTEASWNDDGFFIKLIEERPSEAIHWIWDNRRSEFEKAYPNCDITLDNIDGKLHALSIRILNISMTELIKMTPDNKWYYGDYVYGQEHNFKEIADSVVDDYELMVKAANVA